MLRLENVKSIMRIQPGVLFGGTGRMCNRPDREERGRQEYDI